MRTSRLTVIAIIVSLANAHRKDLEEHDDDDFIPFTGERKDLFDWKLCTHLDEREPGNVIASPLSIKFLLAMLYEGTTGETARLLEKTLQFSSNKAVTRAHNNALLKTLQEPNDYYLLEMEMRLFLDKKYHPKNWYRQVLSQYYGAYVQRINFLDSAAAAKLINEWADVYTHGHIKNLISSEESLSGAELMMANAVYFMGNWKYPFPQEESHNGTFKGIEGPKTVRFMTQTGLFFYADSVELDSRILRLPYKGNKFAMYILLPRRDNGIGHLLSNITPFVLRRLTAQMEEASMEVTIPHFHFDYNVNFNDILNEMGLGSLFNKTGDIHGIAKGRNLAVSNIVQKASIEVTETGTVSTAASTAEFVNKLGISELEFMADHPFLFLIEDETTGTVIFIGKLMNPGVESAVFGEQTQSSEEPIAVDLQNLDTGRQKAIHGMGLKTPERAVLNRKNIVNFIVLERAHDEKNPA